MGDAEIIPLGARGRPGDPEAIRPPERPVDGKPAVDEPSADEISADEISADEPGPVGQEAFAAEPERVAQDPGAYAPGAQAPGDFERRLAELLALVRRRITGDYAVDEYGLDTELTERVLGDVVRPFAERWFRLEVRGAENIPSAGGALLVSNHSGTIPLDGLVTMSAVHEHTGRFLRPLGADLVFRLPFVGEVARKGGATLACNEDATRLLSGGELVGVWPEGFKGIGKPYSERYKLQRFGRGGFVSAAVRTGVPIIPCSVVGAEEIYPLIGNIPALARLIGAPYLPVTPFFPLLGPLGLIPLPSKWIIEFGEPVRTDELDTGQADDPMVVFDVTDQVRETIQQTLYRLLMERKSVFG